MKKVVSLLLLLFVCDEQAAATVRISKSCHQEIQAMKADMGQFYYLMKGAFRAASARPEMTPAALIDKFEKNFADFFIILHQKTPEPCIEVNGKRWYELTDQEQLAEREKNKREWQSELLFAPDYLSLLATHKELVESAYNKTLAQSGDRQQAWNCADEQLKASLLASLNEYTFNLVDRCAAEVELAERGITMDGKTLVIQQNRLRGDEGPLLKRVFGPAPSTEPAE